MSGQPADLLQAFVGISRLMLVKHIEVSGLLPSRNKDKTVSPFGLTAVALACSASHCAICRDLAK